MCVCMGHTTNCCFVAVFLFICITPCYSYIFEYIDWEILGTTMIMYMEEYFVVLINYFLKIFSQRCEHLFSKINITLNV